MANMSTQPFDAYDHTVLDYEGDQNAATPMVESSAVTILPTTTVEVTKPVLTDSDIVGNTEPALHTSYSDIVTKSSQFPMQHATDGLPSNNVTIETTDYQKDILDLSISLPKLELTTSESPESSNTSVPSSQTSSEATDSPPQSSSLSSSIKLPVGSSAKGTTNKIPDLYTSYEPSVSESNSATGFLSSSITNNMQITSISAVLNDSKNVLDSSKDIHIAVSKSVDYVPSTGDLYSPVTASKTVFVAGNSMDASFKSTSAIPLSPSGKPVNTVDPGGTALFGGELTDYILYIGVPVCGLVILVFLIVCVVCLRKRKNKHKGSPTKNHVQDLWVNSQQELPLTTRDPLREVNGGDTIGGHRDLVLRRRKNKQRIKIKGQNALELISQSLDQEENACCIVGTPVTNTNTIDVGESSKEIDVVIIDKADALGELEPILDDLDEKLDGALNDISDNNDEDLNDLDDKLDKASNCLDDLPILEDDFIRKNAIKEDEIKPVLGKIIDKPAKTLDDLDDVPHLEDDFIRENALQEDEIKPVLDFYSSLDAAFSKFDDMLLNEDDLIDEEDFDLDDEEILAKLGSYDFDSDDGTLTGDEDDYTDLLFHDDLATEGCTTYEVVFDFQAELETHLTLKQGDVVQVHRKEGNGWWRGTIGENSGWFPSNYVQAAPQDKLETEDEIEMHSESNVSSFMVQARHTPRQTPIHTPSLRDSLPSEKDIEAEPIYCKIQPKEKRKSFPKVSDKSPSKLAAENTENATTPIEDGSKYMAIYSYGGHFTGELTINKGDIIQGRELDKNGWMKGYNESTNIEGWCPLQYVNRLDKEEISQLDPMVIPNSDSQTSLSPDPLTYKQLEANKGVDKDWVGIIHKAVHTFSGDKAGDLEFEVGDLITVFQVLENGWWLGSKGKVVGWFPGAYVEMIPQPSPRLPRNRSAPSPSNSSQTSDSPVSSDETKSITDWSNDASPLKPKPRPVRKAPPPPIRLDGSSEAKSANPKSPNSVDASESRIPTPTQNKAPQVPRPVKVSPPAPPIRDHSPDPSPLYEAIGKGRTDHISEPVLIQTTINDGVYDLIQHPSIDTENQLKNKIKPDVPRRYIKPKLVKIPRSEINIPSIGPPNGIPGSANIARPRAPPPPRPTEPPKYPRENLQEVREFAKQENEITNNELFFHLPPQNNLGEIPTKDSSDMNMDMDFIYQGMSSFGSTFGKKEENFSNNDAFVRKEETPYDNEDYVTQKSFQSKVKDIEKALGVPSDSTLDKGLDKFNLKEEFVQDNELRGAEECEGALRNTMQQTTMDKPAQKKQQSLSKIQPPKHISLSNSEDKKAIPNVSATEIVQEERQTPKISRIPMSANVSIKDTSVQNIEHRLDKASDRLEGQVEVNDSAVIEHTDITPKELNHDVHNESYNQNSENETSRSRSESFNKPPVAPKPKSKSTPKCLPKQSPDSKYPEGSHDITDNVITNHDIESNSIENTCAEGEPTNKESQKVSKLPKIAQKSPKSKKSGIPASPLMRMKNAEKQSKNVNKQKLSESDSDVPLSPTSTKMNKPESPAMARRGAAKQIVNNEKSIRNRSNSPHARTGIPTSLKQRSNSPSSKLPRMANTPSPGSPSPTSIPQLNNKASGLAPPKKIQTPKQQHSPRNDHVSPESLNQSPDTSFDMTDDDTDQSTTSPKPDRPSKPPRVVKQKSQDVKTSKHGRSLLPVIHKTLDGTNGVTPPTKHKTGIPVSKLPKAASSKAAPEESNNRGPTLFQAVRGYTAQTEEELSFTEGTFVTELSDCDRVGWYVGMLADGSTGLYPAECFKPSPLYNESEA